MVQVRCGVTVPESMQLILMVDLPILCCQAVHSFFCSAWGLWCSPTLMILPSCVCRPQPAWLLHSYMRTRMGKKKKDPAQFRCTIVTPHSPVACVYLQHGSHVMSTREEIQQTFEGFQLSLPVLCLAVLASLVMCLILSNICYLCRLASSTTLMTTYGQIGRMKGNRPC